MSSFDVAIIGSGPVSLFEAIHQSNLGKSVLLIEERRQLGGAWSSIEYEPGHRYEIGCHIWDVDKDAYSFIEKYLGEELSPFFPAPIAVWRDLKIPYDWKNNITALRILMRKPKQFFSSRRKVRMQLIPRNYSYPKGGSEALVSKLISDIKRLNVSVMQGSGVSSVEVMPEGLILTVGQDQVSTSELACTSFSSFPEVKVGDRVLRTNRAEEVFWHFQFVVENNEAKRMSYARILGHPFIHRVSDISSLSQGNNQVFSIGIFTNSTRGMSREDVVFIIESALRKWNWLSPEARVVKHFDNLYSMRRPDLDQRQELLNSGKVNFIQSTNLSFSFSQNAARWADTVLGSL